MQGSFLTVSRYRCSCFFVTIWDSLHSENHCALLHFCEVTFSTRPLFPVFVARIQPPRSSAWFPKI